MLERKNLPVCMPTKQLQELKATLSRRPDWKKQATSTAVSHESSRSCTMYCRARFDLLVEVVILDRFSRSTLEVRDDCCVEYGETYVKVFEDSS